MNNKHDNNFKDSQRVKYAPSIVVIAGQWAGMLLWLGFCESISRKKILSDFQMLILILSGLLLLSFPIKWLMHYFVGYTVNRSLKPFTVGSYLKHGTILSILMSGFTLGVLYSAHLLGWESEGSLISGITISIVAIVALSFGFSRIKFSYPGKGKG